MKRLSLLSLAVAVAMFNPAARLPAQEPDPKATLKEKAELEARLAELRAQLEALRIQLSNLEEAANNAERRSDRGEAGKPPGGWDLKAFEEHSQKWTEEWEKRSKDWLRWSKEWQRRADQHAKRLRDSWVPNTMQPHAGLWLNPGHGVGPWHVLNQRNDSECVSIKVKQENGKFRVEMTKKSADGKDSKTEMFEADSAEEFEKAHGESLREHGIHILPDGAIQVDPRHGGLPFTKTPSVEPAPPADPTPLKPVDGQHRLGVTVVPLENDEGVSVNDVTEGSLASKLGLLEGDVLKSIGGKPITDVSVIRNVLKGIPQGSEIVVEVSRNGEIVRLTTTR